MAQLSDALAHKITVARQMLAGPALDAAIAALEQEHAAAERALLANLADKARLRRREALATLRLLHRETIAASQEPGRAERRPLRMRARRLFGQRRKRPRHTPPKPRR